MSFGIVVYMRASVYNARFLQHNICITYVYCIVKLIVGCPFLYNIIVYPKLNNQL